MQKKEGLTGSLKSAIVRETIMGAPGGWKLKKFDKEPKRNESGQKRLNRIVRTNDSEEVPLIGE
ncbi:MAG: hypothetical protein A2Z25_07210 [Planctomycetes bacterium RBG_16_55_9]|nr:MAG: hypothetical protein A2Z25_07210 [Planctomycetes bacterium RBG_16_55_9]